MTASITITLSDDILKVLKSEKAITLSLDSMKTSRRAAQAPAKRGGRGGGGKSVSGGDYRAGSLPARLVQWAGTRKRPFGVQDVMKRLKVKRAHASMVLTRVMGSGHLKRIGRGEYGAT